MGGWRDLISLIMHKAQTSAELKICKAELCHFCVTIAAPNGTAAITAFLHFLKCERLLAIKYDIYDIRFLFYIVCQGKTVFDPIFVTALL